MSSPTDESVLGTAAWLSEATEAYKYDLENYRGLAENLGCTLLEAMLLNGLGYLHGMRQATHVIEQFLGDLHKREFPDSWASAEE
jgi:hypothetical protein